LRSVETTSKIEISKLTRERDSLETELASYKDKKIKL